MRRQRQMLFAVGLTSMTLGLWHTHVPSAEQMGASGRGQTIQTLVAPVAVSITPEIDEVDEEHDANLVALLRASDQDKKRAYLAALTYPEPVRASSLCLAHRVAPGDQHTRVIECPALHERPPTYHHRPTLNPYRQVWGAQNDLFVSLLSHARIRSKDPFSRGVAEKVLPTVRPQRLTRCALERWTVANRNI